MLTILNVSKQSYPEFPPVTFLQTLFPHKHILGSLPQQREINMNQTAAGFLGKMSYLSYAVLLVSVHFSDNSIYYT